MRVCDNMLDSIRATLLHSVPQAAGHQKELFAFHRRQRAGGLFHTLFPGRQSTPVFDSFSLEGIERFGILPAKLPDVIEGPPMDGTGTESSDRILMKRGGIAF